MSQRVVDLLQSTFAPLVVIVLLGSLSADAQSRAHVAEEGPGAACRPSGHPALLPDLPEASGIAASRARPGTLWAINDSGEPILFALDAQGVVRSRVRMAGATVENWEDVAVAACPGGSCIYVADTGDNEAERGQITIYRVLEPRSGDKTTAPAAVFRATYPDGPRDAESLLVSDDGRMFIVSKGETGPIALYRFPRGVRPGSTVTLERVGPPQTTGRAEDDERITGAATSQDGRWVVLRTHNDLRIYPAHAFFAGTWSHARRVDLIGLHEPQGEGVALAEDRTVYLVGEGGGESKPGTFAQIQVRMGRAQVASGHAVGRS
jgi:hypothetical protein